MSQLPILVPASKLSKSPTNMRRTSDPAADAQLEANIAERGILQNLVGIPVARKKGHYRITAGGRRLDAVHRLIAAGKLAADHPVPVLVLGDASEAIEISLSENFFRLAMNPAEACRAFQDIIGIEGKSPADVALRFGLSERFVLGRLRLASLAEPIFDALSAGDITLDVAMAYASVSDTERQAAIFEQLRNSYYRGNAAEIRRQLAAYSYRSHDPRALLAGRDAYVEAGGRIDRDLFADGDCEHWIDTHIVDRLAGERLATAAEEVRSRDGFAEVRVMAATHVPYGETLHLEPLRGALPDLTEDDVRRQAELARSIADIEAAAEPGPLTEEDEQRLDTLEAELAAIAERPPVVSDEERAQAVAFLVIGPDGAPRVDTQLYVAPADAAPTDAEAEGGEDEADAVPGDESRSSGISRRLADELAIMKTEILAVHVARDPAFAADLGIFLMDEAATSAATPGAIPSELRANAPAPRVADFESRTRAAEAWTTLDAALDRSWAAGDTIEARFDAFRALPEGARSAWLGWAVARTLRAVPDGATGSSFLDHLGRALEIDVAAWWRPTATTFFDRITRPQILDLFAGIGGDELRNRYAGARKHELAASAERLCAGELIVEAETKTRALRWLPDAMLLAVPSAAVDCADEPIDGDAAPAGVETGETEGKPDLTRAA